MTIPYGRQDITPSDIEAVVAVLNSDYLTQGPAVPRFEAAVARHVNAKHAVAVSSATAALHVACMALGLGPGDLLWTVPNTFVASANCARYCGANVDFVDIDPHTWNISVAKLASKLEDAKRIGRIPKVVVPVHFAGQPTEQERIWDLAKQYGFRVLEDASHSVGASRNGEPVGSGRWSDITVFSFHPVKIITTAEGGMAVTNSDELATRMSMLRSHGITRDVSKFVRLSPGPWYYEQQQLGFNYRLTDIQAALGCSQIDRLSEYVDRRNELAKRYDTGLARLPLKLPTVHRSNRSSYHLYVVRLDRTKSLLGHRDVILELHRRGIGVNVHYLPVHLQPYYRELGFSEGQFPEAEAHANEAITLPMYPGLSEQAQDKVMRDVIETVESAKHDASFPSARA